MFFSIIIKIKNSDKSSLSDWIFDKHFILSAIALVPSKESPLLKKIFYIYL